MMLGAEKEYKMTKNEITAIAFKCFGIYWLYVVIVSFPSLLNVISQVEAFGSGDKPSYVMASFFVALSVVISLICIWLLWKLANSIIKPIPDQDTVIEMSSGANELMQVILICMGLSFVIRSLLDFPHQYAFIKLQRDEDPKLLLYKIQMAVIVVKFLLGCLLIAKPKQWAKTIRSIGQN